MFGTGHQWEADKPGPTDFIGQLDDIRFYGHARSDVDILTEFLTKREPVSPPDLIGQWASLNTKCRSTRVGPKCKISGRLNVQNIGNLDAPSSFVRFYLSSDNVYDETDTFVWQVATGSIKAGTSKTKTLRYSFPVGETVSGKYIIAVIDPDNIVAESSECSNYAVFGPIQ